MYVTQLVCWIRLVCMVRLGVVNSAWAAWRLKIGSPELTKLLLLGWLMADISKTYLKQGNDSVPATVHPLQCSGLGNQVFLLSWVTNLTEFQSSVNPSIVLPISIGDTCDRSPNLDTIISLKLRSGCYGVSQSPSILNCWKCLSMSIGLVTWKWWLFQWWLQSQAFQSGRSKWLKKRNCWKPPIGYSEEEAQHSGLLDRQIWYPLSCWKKPVKNYPPVFLTRALLLLKYCSQVLQFSQF